ncbi:hypothetical protein, partial [Micromonospora sp. KC606]|uniref:hypothetical protein n=1 Tax=Micromonospora sp. KC606 TaxID=2530379 RepID=UPI001A9DC473
MTTPSGARHEDDYWRRPPEEAGPASPTPGEAAPPPGRGAESNMPGNDGPDTSGSHAPGRDSHAPGGPGPEVAQLADPAGNDRAGQSADLPPPSSSTDGPATSGEGREGEVLSATAPATWSPWAAPTDVPPPATSVAPQTSGGGTAYHGP